MTSKILEIYEDAIKLLKEISDEFKLTDSEVEKIKKIIKEYLSVKNNRLPEIDNLVLGAVSLVRGDLQSKLVKKFNKPSSTISTIKTRIKERIDLTKVLNNSNNSNNLDKIVARLIKIEKEIKELINELESLKL